MSEPKEFLGKTLDAAIAEACSYYDVPREKLEIEIIEDAKTGIFGIVGARKAKIRARLATLPDFMQGSSAQEKAERQEGRRRGRNERRRERAAEPSESPKDEPKERKDNGREKRQDVERENADVTPQEERVLPALRAAGVPALADQTPTSPADPETDAPAEREEQPDESPRGKRGRQSRGSSRKENSSKSEEPDALESALPRVPLSELDQDMLTNVTKNILSRLVAPVLDIAPEQVDLSLDIGEDRIQVSIKSEDTGLLIGRDGQNLAAVQYLAARMITRAMGSQVRLQVDAGDYHVRQDSRLQELALALAEKVKATGKVQTTRPLSAYQRRVIHLALQDDPDVQTRSSGEGALKHVVILRRKD